MLNKINDNMRKIKAIGDIVSIIHSENNEEKVVFYIYVNFGAAFYKIKNLSVTIELLHGYLKKRPSFSLSLSLIIPLAA